MAFQIDTGGTLENNLEAYWKFEEASGTREDQKNSHDLSVGTGSVPSAAGIVGDSGDFEGGTGDLLSEAHTSGFSPGDTDFTIAGWIYLDSKAVDRYFVSKGDFFSLIGAEYMLRYVESFATDRFQFVVRNGTDTGSNDVTASSFGSPSIGTWYFIEAWHDSVSNQLGIRVNNGTANTAAHTTGVNTNTQRFVVGAMPYNSGNGTSFHDGRIDELGFWRRLLISQERTDLYNGGSGNTWINQSTQTITAATVVLTGTESETIDSDTDLISLQGEETIDSDTSINGSSSQTITAATVVLTGTESETIDSDTTIQRTTLQPIAANTNIQGTTTQTLNTNTTIQVMGVRHDIGSTTKIAIHNTKTIQSQTVITIENAVLTLYAESDLDLELGTLTNPLDFDTVEFGTTESAPNNPYILFNDKGGDLNSVDARNVTASVVKFYFQDELVGISDASPSQDFSTAFSPVVNDSELLEVKVNEVTWVLVNSFAGYGPSDLIYTFAATDGTILFGDGSQGMIPPDASTIKCSYTPDLNIYGKGVQEEIWIGIRSSGVIDNNRTVELENAVPIDLTHIRVAHYPQLISVAGVFLLTDPNGLGTNYFTGGSFNSTTGIITLGTSLPDGDDEYYLNYTYTIADDAESSFTQIGLNSSHEFENPIPSNCGKRLYFRAKVPKIASATGITPIKFVVRFEYRQ